MSSTNQCVTEKKELLWYSNDPNFVCSFSMTMNNHLKLKKEVLVTKISGPDEIEIGQRATYTIDSYNVENVSDEDKKKVKWRIEIYSNIQTNIPFEEVDFSEIKINSNYKISHNKLIINQIPKEWIQENKCNSNIRVYPYKKNYTYKVRASSQIVKKKNSGTLFVNLVSKNDENQMIKFKAKLYQNSKLISSSGSNFIEFWKKCDVVSGEYTLKIEPKSEKTFSTYKNINYNNNFTQKIFIKNNKITKIEMNVSRKESILYDIQYEFYIQDNNKADNSEPIIELRVFSELSENKDNINKASSKFHVSKELIKSIMYMETTHGYYDEPLNWVNANDSLRPMNVNVAYWKKLFTRNELSNKKENIDAGSYMLKLIINRVPSQNIRKIATLYNNINATTVNDYGARVQEIYNDSLYIPPKSLFEQINEEINKFERLSSSQQYDILYRMFGGY